MLRNAVPKNIALCRKGMEEEGYNAAATDIN
jgi:hypothetical protein